jgi:hypothetical protein
MAMIWTLDMNRCNSCPKLKDCEDRIELHKATTSAFMRLQDNKVGSRAGTIVLVCQEPNLIEQEKNGG